MPPEDPYPTFSMSSVTSQLTCCICLRLLNTPVQLICDHLVCASCLCESIRTSYTSLQCPCCDQHTLQHSTISRPSNVILSLLEDVVVPCCRNCNNVVKVKDYGRHLAGNCKGFYVNINSPSKVSLRDVLSKSATSPASLAEVKATHQLVRRVLMSEEGSSSSPGTAKTITVPSGVGGQVRSLFFIILIKYLNMTLFIAYYLSASASSSSWYQQCQQKSCWS